MAPPTLSVILPNYNHAKFLPQCLESLLRQSVQPLEIVIIDDASTDNSVTLIEEFARKNAIIRFYQNERNQGVIFGMNKGVELARGEYVYFAGADDLVLPGLFEKSMRMLAEHKEAGLCCSDPASFVADHGKEPTTINENRLHLSSAPAFFTPDQIVDLARRKRALITGMSVMKRSAILEAGGFLKELKWHCDFFLVFSIALRRGVCYIPERLCMWRSTPGSYLASGLHNWREQRQVVEHILDLLHTPRYSDVLPRFRKSGVLAFTPRVTFTILANRKYWPFLNLALLKRAVPSDIFWTLPHSLQRIIRKLRGILG